MRIIRYGFNRQVDVLCRSLCYLAFGVKLDTDHDSLNNNVFHTGYQSEIALQLYQHYRKDGFKYAQPGTTPKSIAQQLQIHLKKSQYLQHKIDEFGRYKFAPTPTYLQKLTKNLTQNHNYTHLQLSQMKQSGQRGWSGWMELMKRETHYFDFYVGVEVSLSQFRKIVWMEFLARVLEEVNGHEVVRCLYCQREDGDVGRIARILFGDSKRYEIKNVQTLFTTKRQLTKSDHQYLNIHGHNKIPIQSALPTHTLLSSYLGNEPTPIHTLTNTQLQQKLSQQPTGLITKHQPILSKFKMRPTIGEIVFIYGNLLDLGRVSEVERMFGEVRDGGVGIGGGIGGGEGDMEVFGELERSFRQLLKLHFQ